MRARLATAVMIIKSDNRQSGGWTITIKLEDFFFPRNFVKKLGCTARPILDGPFFIFHFVKNNPSEAQ